MLNNKKRKNSVERFIDSENYQRASFSENPQEMCKDCTALFTFKEKTRCYAYEQQRFKDQDIDFHPRRDFNCVLFEDSHSFAYEIEAYLRALKSGVNPQEDAEYKQVLKEENEYYDTLRALEKKDVKKGFDEWDDPNTYARCSDWEDEPDSCFHCADDECPMNKG